MVKKSKRIILALVLIISLFAETKVSAGNVYATEKKAIVTMMTYLNVEGNFVTSYMFNNLSDIGAISMEIDYSKEQLEYVDCEFVNGFQGALTLANESNGKVRIAVASSSGISSDTAYINVTYKPIQIGIQTVKLSYDVTEFKNTLANEVELIQKDKSYECDIEFTKGMDYDLSFCTNGNSGEYTIVNNFLGLNRNKGICGGEFVVEYNPDEFKFIDASVVNFDDAVISYNEIEKGKVKIAFALNESTAQLGRFIQMNFISFVSGGDKCMTFKDISFINGEYKTVSVEGDYQFGMYQGGNADKTETSYIYVDAPSTVDINKNVDAYIVIDRNNGVGCMEAELEYNPDILEVVSCEMVKDSMPFAISSISKQKDGVIKLAVVSDKNTTYTGNLAKITFKGKSQGDSLLKLNLDEFKNSMNEDLVATSTSAKIYVSACRHVWDNDYTIDKEATCTTNGSKSIHCTLCDAVTDVTPIEATGHALDKGVITKQPTYVAKGVKKFSCIHCDYSTEESIKVKELKKPAITVKRLGKAILVKWKKVEGATGYVIYRSEGSGRLTKIRDIKSGSALQYKDTKVKNAKVYAYTVQAKNSAQMTVHSSKKKVLNISDAKLRTCENTSKGVYLKWDKITGVKGYKIYKAVGKGSYKKLATISKSKTTTYIDRKVSNGKDYKYKIVGYVGLADGVNANEIKVRRITAPSITLKKTKTKVVVSIKKNAKATGYEVSYSKDSKFKKAKKVRVKQTKVPSTKLAKSSAKYVRVRSYIKIGKKTTYSAWSSAKKVK